MAKSQRTPEERFWAQVQRSDGCWRWTGTLDTNGYGCFMAGGKRYVASRFAWSLANGPIPHGLHVCHSCDVPSCVRLDHLFLGTAKDNTQDAVKKGRVWSAWHSSRCLQGHAFTPDNVKVDARGHRKCRTCQKIILARAWKRGTRPRGKRRNGDSA